MLFPIIELERVQFVQEFKHEIQDILDNNEVQQFSHRLTDALEAEWGTIFYLIHSRGKDALNIPEVKIRKRVDLLHKCRNKLAHASCCTPAEICELID